MKKFLIALGVAGLFCSGLSAKELRVGATPVPHAQILQEAKGILKKDGIDLVIVNFTDYITPNLALNDGNLDANFFQHRPYLEKMVKDRNLDLVEVAKIHIEPLGLYSKKIKNINELKSGAKIAIPNDPSNGGRALILLHNKKIIALKDPTNLYSTEFDIKSNPNNIKIIPLEAAMLPRVLPDMDGAIINGNYALDAGLSSKDALILEGAESPYANILVVKNGTQNKEEIKKLIKALQSKEIKAFIEKKYKGEVIPTF